MEKKDDGAIAAAPKMVTVCGWCPDAREQTESARAHGYDVSHGICSACEARWREQSEARESKKAGERS